MGFQAMTECELYVARHIFAARQFVFELQAEVCAVSGLFFFGNA